MQKAFDLIVERLEEHLPPHSGWTKEVIEIVNQVAEGYKHVTTCYLQSPCEYQNEDIRVDDSNGGWIPCSERLPEEDEKVYISTKTERVYVGVYTKRYGFEKREGFICDDGFMWLNTALAWQPYILPQPYQPKGIAKDCNNCANYTEPDEVDNGCYMCCKGLDNNYQPKGE